jgi:hypothetical protein
MPGSGFRWRVGSSVPDAECQDLDLCGYADPLYLMLCQDPDLGEEEDLLYPDAECQDPDFGGDSDLLYPDAECHDPDFDGESDLLYLMLNVTIRISVESRIFCT